mmetsp:Transcript_47203/g.85004  ORF Transcript_47203/g.85004 Transcript_47203/m.85004 type:complete len:273 (-) Transcript_47203:96-914(-)
MRMGAAGASDTSVVQASMSAISEVLSVLACFLALNFRPQMPTRPRFIDLSLWPVPSASGCTGFTDFRFLAGGVAFTTGICSSPSGCIASHFCSPGLLAVSACAVLSGVSSASATGFGIKDFTNVSERSRCVLSPSALEPGGGFVSSTGPLLRSRRRFNGAAAGFLGDASTGSDSLCDALRGVPSESVFGSSVAEAPSSTGGEPVAAACSPSSCSTVWRGLSPRALKNRKAEHAEAFILEQVRKTPAFFLLLALLFGTPSAPWLFSVFSELAS